MQLLTVTGNSYTLLTVTGWCYCSKAIFFSIFQYDVLIQYFICNSLLEYDFVIQYLEYDIVIKYLEYDFVKYCLFLEGQNSHKSYL